MKGIGNEENEHIPMSEREIAILSVKRAFILTGLVYLLYNYQRYMASFNKKHSFVSFMYLFILMSITTFLIEVFTPHLSKNIMYGMGWGIGAVLLNRILDYR